VLLNRCMQETPGSNETTTAARRSWGPSWRHRRRRGGGEDPWLCVSSFRWICLYPNGDIVAAGHVFNGDSRVSRVPRSIRKTQRLPGAGKSRLKQMNRRFRPFPCHPERPVSLPIARLPRSISSCSRKLRLRLNSVHAGPSDWPCLTPQTNLTLGISKGPLRVVCRSLALLRCE
jgi:hypothetical protein